MESNQEKRPKAIILNGEKRITRFGNCYIGLQIAANQLTLKFDDSTNNGPDLFLSFRRNFIAVENFLCVFDNNSGYKVAVVVHDRLVCQRLYARIQQERAQPLIPNPVEDARFFKEEIYTPIVNEVQREIPNFEELRTIIQEFVNTPDGRTYVDAVQALNLPSSPPQQREQAALLNNVRPPKPDPTVESAPVILMADPREPIEQFPDWVKETRKRRTPYLPQVGDDVIYFPQGHYKYRTECRKANLENSDPMCPSETDQIFAVVTDIQYQLNPYRHALITLEATNENKNRDIRILKFKHHDLANVPDFVVLRYFYDLSLKIDFKIGARVEALLENRWWLGTVNRRLLQGKCEFIWTQYNSVGVYLDLEETDDCFSPWELQKKKNGRTNGAVATAKELEEFHEYRTVRKYWNNRSPEGMMNRMAKAIEELENVQELDFFMAPVDLELYPVYSKVIPYPINLSTIAERLKNKFYRTDLHLQKEFQMIEENAKIFVPNADANIKKAARLLKDTLIHILNADNPPNAEEYYYALKNAQLQ